MEDIIKLENDKRFIELKQIADPNERSEKLGEFIPELVEQYGDLVCINNYFLFSY